MAQPARRAEERILGPKVEELGDYEIALYGWPRGSVAAIGARFKGLPGREVAEAVTRVTGFSSYVVDEEGRLLDRLGSPLLRRLYWSQRVVGAGGRSSGAIRQGDWKLIEFFDTSTIELYNLARDRGEQQNLADKSPDKAAELAKRLTNRRRDIGAE